MVNVSDVSENSEDCFPHETAAAAMRPMTIKCILFIILMQIVMTVFLGGAAAFLSIDSLRSAENPYRRGYYIPYVYL